MAACWALEVAGGWLVGWGVGIIMLVRPFLPLHSCFGFDVE